MVVPCDCSGSVGHVHQNCIKMWVDKQVNEYRHKQVFCEICKGEIHFKIIKNS